jgi:hypothetical protein
VELQSSFLNSDRGELLSKNIFSTLVADEGVGECKDPEGNGVNPGEGDGGGGGPPSEEQDKQLISNSGGDNTPMGQPGRQEDESGVTTKTHHTQST